MAEIKTVGVVGIGHMGLPIVVHLGRRGYSVVGFDVNPDAVRRLAEAGGTACATPQATAAASDMVLVVVGFDSEVRAVMDGPEGLWQGMRAGQVLAVASTVSAGLMRELEEIAAPRQIGVIDTPLIRGQAAADEGTLLLLTGGEERWLQLADPVLKSFASDVVRLGPVGSGQIGKALNNFLLWANTCADYEMLAMARAAGLDPETARQAMQMGSGANQVLADWNRPRLMPWAEKDMSIVLNLSDALGLSLPLAGVIKEEVKAIKREKGLSTPKPVQ